MKKTLLAAATLAVLTASSQGAVVDGLVNYWNLNGNLSDTGPAGAVTDNGVFDGANGTDGIGYGAGLFGSGISLNGAGGGAAGQENDGFVRITRSADTLYSATSTLSISMWLQADGFDSGWQTAFAHGEGNQYRIARRGGDVPGRMAYAGGSGDIPGAGVGPSVDPGTGWHHVVAISEGGVSTRLWVDGNLVATGGAPAINDDGNSNPAAPDLFIGGNPQTGANNREWWGQIDDVGMWNRVLTDNEIGQIYNQGLAGQALIPEPSVSMLIGLGGFGLMLRRRRR